MFFGPSGDHIYHRASFIKRHKVPMEIGVGRHGPGVKPIRRSGRRPSTYRPLTSKPRCVHRADVI